MLRVRSVAIPALKVMSAPPVDKIDLHVLSHNDAGEGLLLQKLLQSRDSAWVGHTCAGQQRC